MAFRSTSPWRSCVITRNEWIPRIRKIAFERYEEGGWNVIYSNFSDDDLRFEIQHSRTFKEYVARMEKVAGVLRVIMRELIEADADAAEADY